MLFDWAKFIICSIISVGQFIDLDMMMSTEPSLEILDSLALGAAVLTSGVKTFYLVEMLAGFGKIASFLPVSSRDDVVFYFFSVECSSFS